MKKRSADKKRLNLDERWITIGREGKDGKNHGVHVMIDDNGDITKGPKEFIGHNVAKLPSQKEQSESALGGLSRKSNKEDWSAWLKKAPTGTTVVKYSGDKKAFEYMKNSKGQWRNVANAKELAKQEIDEYSDPDKLAEYLTKKGKIAVKNAKGERWNVGSEKVEKVGDKPLSLADAYAKAGITIDPEKVEAAKDKLPKYVVFDEPELRKFMQYCWAGYNLPLKVLRKTNVYRNLEQKRKRTVSEIGYTYLQPNEKRGQIRKKVFDKFMNNGAWSGKGKDENGKPIDLYNGEVKRGVGDDKTPHATIVIGYPAAGKSSSIVNKLSKDEGAFVLDSDAIKELIPEFIKTNGAAVSCVNAEANMIRKKVMEQFSEGGPRAGQNLVIPIIGDSKEGVEKYIKDLEGAGYDIEIRYKKAPKDQSANRMLSRAIETGRIIPLSALGEKDPEEIFEYFKSQKNARGRDYVRTAAE